MGAEAEAESGNPSVYERRARAVCAAAMSGKMVEAGGIEPPSEGLPATATTRLVCDF